MSAWKILCTNVTEYLNLGKIEPLSEYNFTGTDFNYYERLLQESDRTLVHDVGQVYVDQDIVVKQPRNAMNE